MVTALIGRPDRLIYLSGGLTTQAPGPSGISTGPGGPRSPQRHTPRASSRPQRSRSPLAHIRPDVLSNAVDPGWVPTKMAALEQPAIWNWAISPRHGSPSATTQPRSGG